MNNSKLLFTSKTLWFNFVTIVLAVASYYGWMPNPALMDNVSHGLVVASPVINILLRFWTNKAITL